MAASASDTHESSDTMLDDKITFFSFPLEVRRQIYDLAIPVCRLAPFPYLDPAWSMKPKDFPDHHRGLPSLVSVSSRVTSEVLPIVYAHSILEIAPAQQSYNFFDMKLADQRTIPYAYTRLANTFRMYKPEMLRLIKQAHVFSNQADVIDGGAYESLLQWLVEHTSVEDVLVSARVMVRIRGKASFDSGSWQRTFFDNGVCADAKDRLRVLRVWTKASRPPWEYEKMMRLRCKATDGTLSPVQIYFWTEIEDESTGKASSLLQLDPRWLTRANDEPDKVEMLESATPLIDELMNHVLIGQELKDYRDRSRYFEEDAWVYQMVLIAGQELQSTV